MRTSIVYKIITKYGNPSSFAELLARQVLSTARFGFTVLQSAGTYAPPPPPECRLHLFSRGGAERPSRPAAAAARIDRSVF